MKHYRDALTGHYISEEEAFSRDKSTWVEETDFDRGAFLSQIYDELFGKSYSTGFSSEIIVSLRDIRNLFNKYGADLE